MIIRPSVEPAADWSSHAPLGTARTCRVMAITVAGLTKKVAACSSGMSSGTGRSPCRDDGELGPVAPLGLIDNDALALDEPAEQARPDLINDPDPLEARRRRQTRKDPVTTLDDHQVGRIDRAGNHPNADFAGTGLGIRDLADAEHLGRFTEGIEYSGFHSGILNEIETLPDRLAGIELRQARRANPWERTSRRLSYDLRARSSRPHSKRAGSLMLPRNRSRTTLFMATELLVSTDWLAEHLSDPGVRVVDIRGYVVTKPLEPGVEQAEYRGAPRRIPGRPISPARSSSTGLAISSTLMIPSPPRSRRRSDSPRQWRVGGSATTPT